MAPLPAAAPGRQLPPPASSSSLQVACSGSPFCILTAPLALQHMQGYVLDADRAAIETCAGCGLGAGIRAAAAQGCAYSDLASQPGCPGVPWLSSRADFLDSQWGCAGRSIAPLPAATPGRQLPPPPASSSSLQVACFGSPIVHPRGPLL